MDNRIEIMEDDDDFFDQAMQEKAMEQAVAELPGADDTTIERRAEAIFAELKKNFKY